jgi:hypothetical protein
MSSQRSPTSLVKIGSSILPHHRQNVVHQPINSITYKNPKMSQKQKTLQFLNSCLFCSGSKARNVISHFLDPPTPMQSVTSFLSLSLSHKRTLSFSLSLSLSLFSLRNRLRPNLQSQISLFCSRVAKRHSGSFAGGC